MNTVTMNVTPEQAAEWLSNVPEMQRRISPDIVNRYAKDMKSGLWKLTHQSIAIDSMGRVVDGQHRLSAVIKSGLTVEMAITFNAPPASFDHVDIGKPRTVSDIMLLRGVASSRMQVAIARCLHAGHSYTNAQTSISAFQVEHLITKVYPDALAWISPYIPSSTKRRLSATIYAGMAIAFCHVRDVPKLSAFAQVILDGSPVEGYDCRTAIKFRDWCYIHLKGRDSSKDRARVYLISQRAVAAHMNGELLSIFRPTETPSYASRPYDPA